jgi:MSHA pilin protein MshD
MNYQQKIKKKGFTAIEIVIATAILCVGLIPVVASFLKVSAGVSDRVVERTALLQAQGLLDEIRLLNWDETTTDPTVLSSYSAIGLDAGESLPSTGIDDVDDYNGYTDTPLPGYTRSVTVEYSSAAVNGSVITSVGPTNFKMVRVSVTRTGPPNVTKTVGTLLVNGVEN